MSIQTKKEEDDLVHSSYWDRYYEFAPIGEEPVHEWIGSMESLKPFLEANMFGQWPPETNPSIIHLGAGDSVCIIGAPPSALLKLSLFPP